MKIKSFLLLLAVGLLAVPARAELVACVGDSISYGSGISNRLNNSYPAQLERLLREYNPAWEVRNFGVSGATLLSNGDRPYILESAYPDARASSPDVVIIKLGTNDSKPQNWAHKDDFATDYGRMVDVFRSLPSRPEIWICTPVPAFRVNFAIRPEVIRDEIRPLVDQISEEKNVQIIDLYSALLSHGRLFPDGIHPNAEGAGVMAQTIVPYLVGVLAMPDLNYDGVLNLLDFAHLARSWRQEEPSLDVAPPLAGDGLVGYADLLGLGRYWMEYPGLVAHWRFDETQGEIASERPGRFDGTVHGQARWRPGAGVFGGALELDGVDDHVSTDNILNPNEGPFTLFAWVRGGQPGAVIVSQPDEHGFGQIWLALDPSTGGLMTGLTDGGRNGRPLVSAASVADGNWHRVQLVWNGSQRFLRVDGQEVAGDTRMLGKLPFTNADFHFGAGQNLEANRFWAGLIDEIRIYGRAVQP
jgi:lysophospholipase L1-like esterase